MSADDTVITSVVAGLRAKEDEKALVQFLSMFGPTIIHNAVRMGQGGVTKQDAQEILQDTALAVYEGIDSFDGANFSAWIRTIAKNKTLDLMKRRRKVDQNELADEADRAGSEYDQLDEAQAGELRDRLEILTERLPTQQRETVHAYVAADSSSIRGAQALGVPVGTFRSNLHLARITLAHGLANYSTTEPRAQTRRRRHYAARRSPGPHGGDKFDSFERSDI